MRRTRTRPGGRPARPGEEGQAHAYTRQIRALRPPNRKARCRLSHETASVHRPGHPSKDGRYGKPDASVTGSTHANHRSARSPRPTPHGPARNNPVTGPETGTTRRKHSAAASAAASRRHKEPGPQPASTCPAQPPSKSGSASFRAGEKHHGVGKANRSTESDRTGRGAAHKRGAKSTPERHATCHHQGTLTGAKQQRHRMPQSRAARTTHKEPRFSNRCQATHKQHTTNRSQEWRGTSRGFTLTHTAQNRSQEWRDAAESRV